MLLRLLLLFTLVPLAELALLLWIGGRIGLLATVTLILVTGALGAALARRQGLATWRRFQEALAAGRLPGRELLEGLLILVAAALLLTPGVLTDAAGFLLLVPPARRWIVRRADLGLRGRLVVAGGPPGPGPARGARSGPDAGPEVIDAEFEVVDPAGERRN